MKSVFIDAKWEGDYKFDETFTNYLKENNVKSVALFASVNFLENQEVRTQLEDLGIEVLISRGKRTHKEGQILGCDSYHNVFDTSVLKDADMLMYVGDGMFHPEALLFAQMYEEETKPVVIWNPVDKKMQIIDKDQIQSRITKTKANLMKFMMAKTVGILVSVKSGQSFLNLAKMLKEKIDKKVYIFVDDTFEYKRMEDYHFVDVWVNTACPRIGQDDVEHMPKPLVNIREALDPEKALSKLP